MKHHPPTSPSRSYDPTLANTPFPTRADFWYLIDALVTAPLNFYTIMAFNPSLEERCQHALPADKIELEILKMQEEVRKAQTDQRTAASDTTRKKWMLAISCVTCLAVIGFGFQTAFRPVRPVTNNICNATVDTSQLRSIIQETLAPFKVETARVNAENKLLHDLIKHMYTSEHQHALGKTFAQVLNDKKLHDLENSGPLVTETTTWEIRNQRKRAEESSLR